MSQKWTEKIQQVSFRNMYSSLARSQINGAMRISLNIQPTCNFIILFESNGFMLSLGKLFQK